jgi:hypothetical protein
MTIIYSYGDIDRKKIIVYNNTNSLTGWIKKFRNKNSVLFNLANKIVFPSHRSGWKYAMDSLEKIRDDKKGIYIDDFIERTFSWGRPLPWKKTVNLKNKHWEIEHDDLRKCSAPKNIGTTHCVKVEKDLVIRWCQTDLQWVKWDCTDEQYSKLELAYQPPVYYQFPWIGFWHNPPDVRAYVNSEDILHCPHFIMMRREFIESLKYCRGIFVFSETMAQWVRQTFNLMGANIPVSTVYHPTESVSLDRTFSYDKFIKNGSNRILQIGSWLRDPTALFNLPNICGMKKTWVCGDRDALVRFCKVTSPKIKRNIEKFLEDGFPSNTFTPLDENTDIVRLSNDAYDEILTENIVFTRLLGSSCNNGVIECIVRKVPLLINKLDAVVEYLGEDYPFYYSNLNEAKAKAENKNLIDTTTNFMAKECPTRDKLTGESFLDSILDSEIIDGLIEHDTLCLPCIYRPDLGIGKIDFVVTWVSSESQKWRQSYVRDMKIYKPDGIHDASTVNRFRSDFNELKYCLRSIDSACYDILGKIYLVVHDDQELPKWLNTCHPNIVIVRHSHMCIDASYNSLAIESGFHKIKELSQRFVYLNDDIWLLGRWTLDDFIVGRKVVMYMSDHEVGKTINNKSGSFDYIWYNNHKLLDKMFPEHANKYRPILDHTPYVINKRTLRILNRDNDCVRNIRNSKIRSKHDVGIVCGLSQYVDYYSDEAIMKNTNVLYLSPEKIAKNKVCTFPPEARVVSFQDDSTMKTSDYIKNNVFDTLNTIFNEPSRFEYY